MHNLILEYPIYFLARMIGFFQGNFLVFAFEAVKILAVSVGWIGGLTLFVWWKEKHRFSKSATTAN
jgi:hypothetical protein